ncbi:MAG TPA: amidohydrolase family protein [Steroidobacteraceae bacterium]|nr:amidohydrolase family protein [Steroidobacteraceae bacterium]
MPSIRSVVALALFATLVATAAAPRAQEYAKPPQGGTVSPPPPGIVVVHAGRLLDRPGRAPRGASTLVIRDGRISEVRDGFVDVPGAALVVDQRTRFVLPGLIDSHVHLDSDTGGQLGALEDMQLETAEIAYNALVNAHKTLRAGFTTVRNLGDSRGVTLALRDAIRAGKVVGPNIVDAGRSISTTSGHMDAALGYREDLHEVLHAHDNLCDSVEACRRVVRTQVGRGVDVIKIATTGGVNSQVGAGLGKQMFDDEARAVVATAKLYGKKVAVHAHGADGIQVALDAGVDSIEHGTLLDEKLIAQMVKQGTYYVPTLSTVNGYIERLATNPDSYSPEVRAKVEWRIKVTGQSLEKAVPRGVKVAFGTDAGVSKHGRNADEFELMVKHGMTPAAAIEAATVNAAGLLGLGADVGSLEPGKRADLIAVDGNPLDDVTVLKRVPFVMKDGQEFGPGPG